MNPESNPSKTKICPTCGTRLSENATRCLVCGTEFNARPESKVAKKAEKSVQANRMPAITLSLPAAVGILAVVIIVAATLVYFSLRASAPDGTFDVVETATPTETPTASQPATATLPATEIPTSTNIPPFDYTVAAGDGSCSQLAYNFSVSVQSIIIANNLPSTCPISVGQKLKIPYPTPTIPPAATNTPEPVDATKQACETVPITVQENDTLSSIAANYAVPPEAIKTFNGKTTDNVFIRADDAPGDASRASRADLPARPPMGARPAPRCSPWSATHPRRW